MYVRPPSSSVSKMKLPENYGGNAFSQPTNFGDIPPQHIRSPLSDIPESEHTQKKFGSNMSRSEPIPAQFISEPRPRHTESYGADHPAENQSGPLYPVDLDKKDRVHNGSIFSSLLPGVDISSHFPFGHGLGGEELLILAVMFLVYISGSENGKADNEFLLLLGLLLFAG